MANPIRLIVGLGNPGTEHERDRHNAGFWLVDRIAGLRRVDLKKEGKFQARVARFATADGDAWLLQPQTYMNLSGAAVSALAGFYKITPDHVLVVHDDLDLPAGGVKLKLGGGHGGHNGLRDIAARLATTDFWRLRIGIGHPRDSARSEQDVADFVLQSPRKEEQALIDDVIDRSLALLDLMLAGQMEQAMHKLHSKPKQIKDSKE
ncbi:MAG: aminoacyl-tRNA hydrolase [Proteobacteria bacterium]|nr:aminoacyl-tRNA hydrolase [Pseudomonadota bacterium]